MCDHSDERSQDAVVSLVQRSACLTLQVPAAYGEVDPHLGFCGFGFSVGELAYERGGISAFAPGLSQVRAHRTRGSPHLVRQRVHLVFRKLAAQLENLHCCIESPAIHVQILVYPCDLLRHDFLSAGFPPHTLTPSHPHTLTPSVAAAGHRHPRAVDRLLRDHVQLRLALLELT